MSTLKNLHRQARRSAHPAFTLLELIVVLLVLGILAAIAVPTFQRVRENAVSQVLQSTLETLDRDGEAIAVSDFTLSDSQIAQAVVAEVTPKAGMTLTQDGATITVEYANASVTFEGSVVFSGGVGEIIPAMLTGTGGGGGGGGPSEAYAVGNVGPGGGIVFITPSTSGNTTGLYFEAAPLADVAQATWCSNTDTLLIGSIPYGTNFDIGTGASNTSTADAVCTSGAIQIAADYTNNGFSDWFLPSSTELNEMRNGIYNLGGVSGYYWSSTENIYQPGVADAHDHASNTQSGLNKSSSNYVRPVRSFSA
jgi:prepilin-type N-terminal cleavage/methylation domain-containing protein